MTHANDPHETGIPWTPGSFPLNVAPDGGTVFVEKSPSVGAVTGTATLATTARATRACGATSRAST